MGGLSKRAYLVEQLKKSSEPTLLLDSGNLLYKKTEKTQLLDQDILSANTIIDIYRLIDYDAMAVGPHDLSNGVEPLVQSFLAGSPWISANLLTVENTTVFPPWLVLKTVNGRVGILGLTAETTLPDNYHIENWQETLPRYLDQIVATCDIIILLSNLDSTANEAIAKQFPQITLIISADQKKGNVPPTYTGNSLITQTHTRGMYLGVLKINIPELKSWQDRLHNTKQASNGPGEDVFEFQFRSLAKHIQESDAINERISLLKNEISSTNRQSQAGRNEQNRQGSPNTRNIDNQIFAGPTSCSQCHEKQYLQWQQTTHAHSLKSLIDEQQQFNIKCLSCHVTRDITADRETKIGQNLLSIPDELRMVGCESCHGPALAHIESKGQLILTPVTEASCRVCHTPEMDDTFSYQEKLKHLGCSK